MIDGEAFLLQITNFLSFKCICVKIRMPALSCRELAESAKCAGRCLEKGKAAESVSFILMLSLQKRYICFLCLRRTRKKIFQKKSAMNLKILSLLLSRRRKMGSEFYESVKKGLEQAAAYERGDKTAARSVSVSVAQLPEYTGQQVKAIRSSLGLTQKSFAYVIGVSKKTVEAWESSRNTPQGPARRFLALMDMGGKDFLQKYHLIGPQ